MVRTLILIFGLAGRLSVPRLRMVRSFDVRWQCVLGLLLVATGAKGAVHSYWRLYITAGNSAIDEIQMFDINGNSLVSGGTASASSCYAGCGGSYSPGMATDGNFSTFWTAAAQPAWWQYQFPLPVDVAVVRMVPRPGGGGGGGPSSFTVQYSDDGVSWTNSSPSYSGVTWSGYGDYPGWAFAVATPPAGTYLNLRMNMSSIQGGSGGTPYAAYVAELRFNGFLNSAGNFVTAPYATDLLSWTESSFLFGCCHGNKSFDGNLSTFWSASAPNFVATVLPAFYKVTQISVTAPNPVPWGPKDVTVDGSNDGGVTWTTVFSGSFGVWSNGQTQTLGTGCPAREYIRLGGRIIAVENCAGPQ